MAVVDYELPVEYEFFFKNESIFSQWNMRNFVGPAPEELLHRIDINRDNYELYIHNKTFCCCEQWMMLWKALLHNDTITAEKILATRSPKSMKMYGRKVQNFDEALWDRHKFQIVVNGNYLKFLQNPDYCAILLNTNNKLIAECSPYDAIWGTGANKEKSQAQGIANWKGQNLLGKALMTVREILRKIDLPKPIAQTASHVAMLPFSENDIKNEFAKYEEFLKTPLWDSPKIDEIFVLLILESNFDEIAMFNFDPAFIYHVFERYISHPLQFRNKDICFRDFTKVITIQQFCETYTSLAKLISFRDS
jgi:ribA/ribD-fused uncharacterized protein